MVSNKSKMDAVKNCVLPNRTDCKQHLEYLFLQENFGFFESKFRFFVIFVKKFVRKTSLDKKGPFYVPLHFHHTIRFLKTAFTKGYSLSCNHGP